MSTDYKTQIEQIITCLQNPKTRKAALEVLLSLSESPSLVEIFIQTNLPKHLLRLLENEDIPEKDLILEILINQSSSNEKYIDFFNTINTFHRIIQLLFTHIDSSSLHKGESQVFSDPNDVMISHDMFLNKQGTVFNMKLELDKYVIESSSISNTHSEFKDETLVNLYCMFLANLTSYEKGQMKLLDTDNANITGIVYFKLIDKYFEHIYHNCFDFCSSAIANVTSLKKARELLLENKVFKIFIAQFDKMNNMKIINNLRLIRNCCFEYEKYIDELLYKNAIMFNYLIYILCVVNNAKEGFHLEEIYFANWNKESIKQEDKEVVNDLIVDVFLILTNSNNAVQWMKLKNVDKALDVIEMNNKDNEIKYKDRITVIKNYLLN